MSKPYIVSQDKKSGVWYCHMKEYPHIPVFGSIGDKKKATHACMIQNASIGKGGVKNAVD